MAALEAAIQLFVPMDGRVEPGHDGCWWKFRTRRSRIAQAECPGRSGKIAVVRTVLGVIAAIVAWLVIVTLIDRPMRALWPDYAANFTAMTFTLPMMLARLTESTVALVLAALIALRVAPASRNAAWGFGIVMFLIFAPYHLLMIWSKFPIWYHAYFLTSLLAVPAIVASVMRETAQTRAAFD